MKHIAAITALLLAGCFANPHPSVSIDDAWARATLPGQTASAAYFTIRNSGGPDKLLSVSSPSADASMHSTSMDNGVMRMRPIAEIDLPAKATVEFKPGGNHVMLSGLKDPLRVGATLQLDLKFEKSGMRHVAARVRAAGGAAM